MLNFQPQQRENTEIAPKVDHQIYLQNDEEDEAVRYKRIPHCVRLSLIHAVKTLGYNKGQISTQFGLKYSSVSKIIKAYEQNGRTNKK